MLIILKHFLRHFSESELYLPRSFRSSLSHSSGRMVLGVFLTHVYCALPLQSRRRVVETRSADSRLLKGVSLNLKKGTSKPTSVNCHVNFDANNVQIMTKIANHAL